MTHSNNNEQTHKGITENLSDLSPRELSIWKTAKELSTEPDAAKLKKSSVRILKRMGCTKEETAFFHAVLKELALQSENTSLTEMKPILDERDRNSTYYTQKNIRCTVASFLCTICALTTNFGTDIVQNNAETLNLSSKTQQTLQSVENISGAITRAGAFAMTLFGGSALLGAGTTFVTRRQQRKNNEKQNATQIALKENALLQQQLLKEIRQRN